ncbi:MAG: glycoside hydrolase family 9 protein [Clostridiales Family XIII bacterium]|jgi:hypothetical protein|nr:glycoside hydrolase family 9 protein [Clostridiales Family XIII bacterium]
MLKKRVLAWATAFALVIAYIPYSPLIQAEAAAATNESYMLTLTNEAPVSGVNYNYLTYPGFEVFMYNNGYNGVFGDEHMSGITFTLHGERIAGNGDIHLLPVPEQWDAAAPATSSPISASSPRTYDRANNTITLPMKYIYNSTTQPQRQMNYDLVATPEPGGVALSVTLKSDLPSELAGSASFNLEFIPSLYNSKSYQADSDGDGVYDSFGVFPLAPEDPMDEDWPRPTLIGNAWYVDQWNTEKGPYQPRPFVQGYNLTFAPEDSLHRISISSDKQISVYDGRNRSQNGWFTAATRIPAGSKAGETVVTWHIKAPVQANWTRPANIAHSQAGYGTGLSKVAVMELDKNDADAPSQAELLHVNADGSYDVAFAGALGAPRAWARYVYRDFDFSSVTAPGLYAIRYDGIVSDVFPIADDVYDRSWQSALSGFLAVQMDHIQVREGYRIWHSAPHMDDARVGESFANSPTTGTISWFDGQRVALDLPQPLKDKGYKPGDRIPGLNQGGWFDAGDFDIQLSRNVNVLRDLINVSEASNNMDGHDTLSVTWDPVTGGDVEMHRPDGIPDVVQQVKHGAMHILAEYQNVGCVSGTLEVPTLRQYTHLGDANTDTDGYIYDKTLGENEIVERDGKVYSGKNDDRMLMIPSGTAASNMGGVSIDLAGAAAVTREHYPEFAAECLAAAEEIWNAYGATTTTSNKFNMLAQFMLATKGTDKYAGYKAQMDALLAANSNPFGSNYLPIASNLAATFILDLMDEDYRQKVVSAALATMNSYAPVAGTPFGYTESLTATWGPISGKLASAQNAAILYMTLGDIEGLQPAKDHIIRFINYVVGTHPYNNTSWLTGVGVNSHTKPYNSNRAEQYFIPGSIVPGYVSFKPDFPESLDNFSYLWAENESIIDYQSRWMLPALVAGKITKKASAVATPATTKDFSNNFSMKAERVDSINPWTGQPERPLASLKSPGFELFMYNTEFSQVFGDQHCAGVELILNGRRIATNGDIHLLPTPEQWDATPAPIINDRTADLSADTVSASLTLPGTKDGLKAPVDYRLIAEPEDGGLKLTLRLSAPLPGDLAGKAGLNLELIPSLYKEKSFQVDSDGDGVYDKFGVVPLVPEDNMEIKDRARTDDQAWYVKEWNKDRGDYQPLPVTAGTTITLSSEDAATRIRFTSDSGDLQLLDGRVRAQNGWFVLRTLIPAGGTEVVWHISPDTDGTWTREPNVAHSQAGYAPSQDKVAVMELDPNFAAPATASVDKLNPDGSYTTVFTGALGAAKRWLRYDYRNFDFSAVTEPGVYAINYAGTRSDVFPIADSVYDKSWQQALSGFLAKEMDHINVRETYKIVHAASHMDDAIMWPLPGEAFRDVASFDGSWFDGQDFYETSRSARYKSGEHIPGLNKGGWYDAGDYDQEATRIQGVIEDLAFAYKAFDPQYDTLAVNWNDQTGGSVELHRPDGTPDIVQQVKHGAMQVLARIEAIGYNFKVLEVPTLRQYTHLGGGDTETDGYVYDPSLGAKERDGLRSGKNDDRLAMVGEKSPSLQYGAAAALAAAYYVVKDYDREFADRCLNAAKAIWAEEELITSLEGLPPANMFPAMQQMAAEWAAAVELLIATEGDAEYKDAVQALFPMMKVPTGWFMSFASGGWKAALTLPYMSKSFRSEFEDAVRAYVVSLDASLADNPFGVPSTVGMWGGSTDVVDMGMRMYFLHKTFPGIVGPDYTLRAANYILGTHPYNSTSWLSGVGTNSVKHAYGNTRADDTYVAGGIVPGYVNISPDFPEALDDFGMLWFENEYVIDTAAKWVTVGNAASELAKAAKEGVAYSADAASDGVFAYIDNNSGNAVSGNAIVALYDETGALTAYDSKPFDAAAGERVTVALDADLSGYLTGAYTCKVYFWNNKFSPLCAPVIPKK